MSMVHRVLGSILLISVGAWAADTTPAPASAPATAPAATTVGDANTTAKTFTGDAAKIKMQMDELFAASKQVKMAGETGKSARRKVESALDWDRVGRDCLGKDIAGKQSAANLKKFNDLLRDVVTKTAYTRLDSFWKSVKGYDYDTIEVKKDTAQVNAKFTVDVETYDLEYFLAKKNGLWWVTDISFEGVRYSNTIHEKLKEFFQEKKSFPVLLEKLEKRRQELVEEEKKPAKTTSG